MSLFRVGQRVLAMASLWVACGLAGANPSQGLPPIEDFFRLPMYRGGVLSPDGRLMAIVTSPEGRRTQLAVVNLHDFSASKAVIGLGDTDINRVFWVNNKRLVFDVAQLQEASEKPVAQGLWAIDVDGENLKQLVNAESSRPSVNADGIAALKNSLFKERREELLPWTWHLHRVLEDGSDDVIIEESRYNGLGEFTSAVLARLDTRNGRKSSVLDNAPPHVYTWLVDKTGRPVAATAIDKDRYAMYLPSADARNWILWREDERFNSSLPSWYEAGPRGQLYLVGNPSQPTGTQALLRMDTAKPEAALQDVMNIKGYDFSGELVFDEKTGRLLGIHYEGESRDSVWFDAQMKVLQAAVDKALPATVNQIDCRDCLNAKLVLVKSSSDRQPTIFSSFQPDSLTLKPLLSARPWIKPQEMARREPMRISARDGLSLPLVVTRPKSMPTGANSKAMLPTVLLVHGGPYVRGNHWEWSAEAQFLASRGYLVIEPDFRGSSGYGTAHSRAGWKQWGLAMQDDLADAVQWAIKSGSADPNRICIAGASYGGYAAMMGLIKQPELFRCGINWVGVSDLKLLFSSLNSDASELGRSYDLVNLIGHPDADSERLDATSPLKQAARLKRPLLMAYGALDRRVPMEHGLRMRDALAAAGHKSVEWVLYPEERHGWRAMETNKDFWGRVERFLQQHIGMPP
ncbi:alpha/beta fold hydrolase [Paucibacter sp. TC2R-5]|uniref:alpha/beta hydrolase family protein n=1 Tax=Paucibacter sp. TC2R-5 TaxID=2893555 RepID=UPI0021E3F373|nr:alpha/beta fold hydrolase [Paucibacter sp. TC2R-5]MCV2360876.1 alpha/beta fold hydrolase [Paucibacter sp. TC2R-5]